MNLSDKSKSCILVLLLIGIVVLGIMNMNYNSRINNLESSIQSMHNNVQGLYSGQYDISAKIDAMNEQAAKNAKLSFDETTFIKEYHEAAQTADVHVSFALKQFGSADIVNVIAQGRNGKTFDAVASSPAAGRFSATLALPIQDNYVLSFTASGPTTTAGELTTLSIGNGLCERFKYELGTGQTTYHDQGRTDTTLWPIFSNDTQGNNALKVKEISMIVESGDTVVGTWNLTPYLKENGTIQSMNIGLDEKEQLQMAAGENTSSDAIAFTLPETGAVARIVFTDNMGVRYEQTDMIYNSGTTSGSGSGRSGNSSSSGSTSTSNVLIGTEERGYGDGYIHLAP